MNEFKVAILDLLIRRCKFSFAGISQAGPNLDSFYRFSLVKAWNKTINPSQDSDDTVRDILIRVTVTSNLVLKIKLQSACVSNYSEHTKTD